MVGPTPAIVDLDAPVASGRRPPLGSSSDAQLLAALRGGDEDARIVTELIARHASGVRARCFRYFGSGHADAEDAVQDTLLAFARSAGRLDPGTNLAAWLGRVATNKCHDIHRRRARSGDSTSVEELTDRGVVDTPEVTIDLRRAWSSLDALDPVGAALLLAVSVEGRTYAEAAAYHGMPVGSAKSRVHRVRARLHASLAAA